MKSNVISFNPKRKTTCLLTISLLVSNRKDTIRKCLDSVKPLLDQLSSELIVVDTVGEENSDGSLEIAREYTDHIVRYEWNSDFAAARNAGMREAGGEWFLFLDDDEWFEDVSELVKFFRSDESKKYNSLSYIVRSYFDWGGKTYTDTYTSRTTRMFANSTFRGKVHEQITPWLTPLKTVDTFAHHYGYIFKDKSDLAKHSDRNVSLLLEEIENDSQNLRHYMQLSNEYFSIAKFKETEEIAWKGLTLPAAKKQPTYSNFLMTMIVRSYIKREQYVTALEQGRMILETYQPYEMGRAVLYREMARCCCMISNHEEALACFDQYLELTDQLNADRDLFESQVMMDLSDYLKEKEMRQVLLDAVVQAQQAENYSAMLRYLVRLPWEPKDDYIQGVAGGLMQAVCKAERVDELQEICYRVVEKGKLPLAFKNAVRTIKDLYPDKSFLFTQLLAQIDCPDPFLVLQKALAAEYEAELDDRLEECLRAGITCAFPNNELLLFLLRTGRNPKPFLSPMPAEDWVASVHLVASSLPVAEIPLVLEQAQEVLKPVSKLRHYFLSFTLRQKMILHKDIEVSVLWEQLPLYAEDVLTYGHLYYNNELFEEENFVSLPKEIRFCIYLEQAFTAHAAKDEKNFFSLLKTAVKEYPAMKEPLRILAEDFKESELQGKDEFQILARKIKKQINELILLKQYVEASALVSQLKMLLPNDSELDEMERNLARRQQML